MFSFFYNLALACLLLLALPKMLWQCWRTGKYRGTWLARLGFKLPKISRTCTPIVWVHAVSLGETRAILPLLHRLMKEGGFSIVISSTTATGHAEALRSLPEALAHFYLPFDFSWVMRRWMRRIAPKRVILAESDFWYHWLLAAKKEGAKVSLVNGKVSERSARRFQHFPFFTRRLFSHFDHLCVQNEEYRQRWIAMGISPERMTVTGNLKWDVSVPRLSSEERIAWKQSLGIMEGDRVLVIGSTHADEELPLLESLKPLKEAIASLKILWVPRHPERFKEVEALLKEHGWGVGTYSDSRSLEAPIVLVDAMGVLNRCYQVAEVAIVAGSFTAKVGGHNILEPIMFGVPVLFGPQMHSQQELRDLVLKGKAGSEVTFSSVASAVSELMKDPDKHKAISQAGKALLEQMRGATDRTYTQMNSKVGNLAKPTPQI